MVDEGSSPLAVCRCEAFMCLFQFVVEAASGGVIRLAGSVNGKVCLKATYCY